MRCGSKGVEKEAGVQKKSMKSGEGEGQSREKKNERSIQGEEGWTTPGGRTERWNRKRKEEEPKDGEDGETTGEGGKPILIAM